MEGTGNGSNISSYQESNKSDDWIKDINQESASLANDKIENNSEQPPLSDCQIDKYNFTLAD